MNYVKRDLEGKRTLALDPLRAPRTTSPRFTISYKLVAPLAIVCDALIILAMGDLSAYFYQHYIVHQSVRLVEYGALASIVAALFIAIGKSEDLYETPELLNFKAQARKVALNWIVVFLFVASVGFAMKVGALFSRGSVLTFFGLGLCGLVGSRIAWRVVLADGMAVRRFSGRKVALIIGERTSEIGHF